MLCRYIWQQLNRDIHFGRVHFKLQNGAYGFTMLEDKDFYEKDRRPAENTPHLSSMDEAVDDSPSTR
jgi:hypothetical protein